MQVAWEDPDPANGVLEDFVVYYRRIREGRRIRSADESPRVRTRRECWEHFGDDGEENCNADDSCEWNADFEGSCVMENGQIGWVR